ncbi:MAG: hypothetical protein ACYC3I_23665 [Gemmataceae bacterium]
MTPSDTSRAAPQESRDHPSVRNYMLYCFSALFLLVVCLVARGLERWSLLPPLIGCLTLLLHWSHGPPLVLLSLVGLLGARGRLPRDSIAGWLRFQTPTLMDFVLCVAVLVYVVGHYRMLSLTRRIFPPDPRRPRAASEKVGLSSAEMNRTPRASAKRSAGLVTVWELASLWFALPVWAGLAAIAWMWVMDFSPPLDLPRELWQVLRLVWGCLTVLTAAGIAASYLRRTTATPEESLLYLQDQCWRLTRREQSNLNRWLTWARLRAQRRKESP